jgi:hypothetical protein
MVESCVFSKTYIVFPKKTSNKGLNKNWFPAKFQKTLYGIDFAMTFWMNLMAVGAQVIAKQLDCIYQKISLPGKAQVID